MYEVILTIGANAKEYWASMEFTDEKGTIHRRRIREERSASKQSNVLEALISALKIIENPCMLNIYSDEDYLIAAYQNGWVNNWQQHGWTNKKGREVRNAGQWKMIWELMAPHSRRVMKCQKV